MVKLLEPHIEPQEYVEFTRETAVYPGVGEGPSFRVQSYLLAGFMGEVGEVAQIYKRVLRDNALIDVDEMALELGDLLWYWARIVDEGVVSCEVEELFRGLMFTNEINACKMVLHSATSPLNPFEEYPPCTVILSAGYEPRIVAARNVEKLRRRLEEGTIKGKGDR